MTKRGDVAASVLTSTPHTSTRLAKTVRRSTTEDAPAFCTAAVKQMGDRAHISAVSRESPALSRLIAEIIAAGATGVSSLLPYRADPGKAILPRGFSPSAENR